MMAWSSAGSGETVVFRYPARYDTFRRLVAGTAVEVNVDDCVFAPGGGREDDVHAEQVAADAELYAPPDAPAITALDQVLVRGETYEVTGKPRYWLNETVVIPLRRVTG